MDPPSVEQQQLTSKKIQDYQVPVRATLTCPRELKICQVLADSLTSPPTASGFLDEYSSSTENRPPDAHTKNTQQQLGVFADTFIPENTIFGPLVSGMVGYLPDTYDRFVLRLVLADGTAICYFDLEDLEASNWMACVRCARWKEELNVEAFQHPTSYQIFYRTKSNITPGEELRVWYTDEYAKQVHCTQPLKSLSSHAHLNNDKSGLTHPQQLGRGTTPATATTTTTTTGRRGTKRPAQQAPSRQLSAMRANSSSVCHPQTTLTNSLSASSLLLPPPQQKQLHDVMIHDWLASSTPTPIEIDEQPAATTTKRGGSVRSKREISLIRRDLMNSNTSGDRQKHVEWATMSANSTSHTPQLDAAAANISGLTNINYSAAADDDDDVEMIENPNDTFFYSPLRPNPLANTNALLDALSAGNDAKALRLFQSKNCAADLYAASAAAAAANSQLTTMMMMLTKDNQNRQPPSSSNNNNNNNNPSNNNNNNNNNSVSTNSSASTAPTTPTNFSRKKNILMSFTSANHNALPALSRSSSSAQQQQQPSAVQTQSSMFTQPSQIDSVQPSSSFAAPSQQHHHLMSLMMAAAAVGGNNNETSGESISSSSLPLSTSQTPSQVFHFPSPSPSSSFLNHSSSSTTNTSNIAQHLQQAASSTAPMNNSNRQQQLSQNNTNLVRQQQLSALLPTLMANAGATGSSQQQQNLMASLLAFQQQQQQQQQKQENMPKPSVTPENSAATSFFFGSNKSDAKLPVNSAADAHALLLSNLISADSTRSTGGSSGGSSGVAQPPAASNGGGGGGGGAGSRLSSANASSSSNPSNPISNSSNTDSDSPIVVDLESEEDDEVAAIDLRVQHRMAAEQQQSNILNAFQFPAAAPAPAAASPFQSPLTPASSSQTNGPSTELAAFAAAVAALAQQQSALGPNNTAALSALESYKQLLLNAAVAAASKNNNTPLLYQPASSPAATNAKSILSFKLAAKHAQENNHNIGTAASSNAFTQPNGGFGLAALPPSTRSSAMANISQLLGLPATVNSLATTTSMVPPPAPVTPNWAMLCNAQQQSTNSVSQDTMSPNLNAWLQQQSQQQNSPLFQPSLNMLVNSGARGCSAMTPLDAWRNSLITSQQQQQLPSASASSFTTAIASTLPTFSPPQANASPSLHAFNPTTFLQPSTNVVPVSIQEQALQQHQRLQKILEQQRKQKLDASTSRAQSAANVSASVATSQSPSTLPLSLLATNGENSAQLSATGQQQQQLLLNGNASMATSDPSLLPVKTSNKLPTSSSATDPNQPPPVKKREKTKKPSVPCATCGKSFSAAKDLKRHLATHTGIKPHPCQHCGKKFSRKDHVRRHVMTVHDKTYRPKKKPPKNKLLQQQQQQQNQDGSETFNLNAAPTAFSALANGNEHDALNNAAESQSLVVSSGAMSLNFPRNENDVDMKTLREQDEHNRLLELRALVDVVRPDESELAESAAAAATKKAAAANNTDDGNENGVKLPLDRRSISPLQVGVSTNSKNDVSCEGFRNVAPTVAATTTTTTTAAQDFGGLIWHNYTNTAV